MIQIAAYVIAEILCLLKFQKAWDRKMGGRWENDVWYAQGSGNNRDKPAKVAK